MATTAGGKKGGKGSKKGKPPVKKKNKRGIRSRDAQDRRIQSGQAKRLARASQGQGASSAEAPRQVVLTYTAAEAKAKAKAAASRRPVRLVEAKQQAQPEERIRWKKERKRRRRRSHDPRIVLKSVAREEPPAEAVRLKSVSRPVQKARKRAADIKGLLAAAKKDWDKCNFEGRVKIQGLLRKHLPRGSISESLKQKAGLAEACSSCDERVTKYRPLVRRRVLRRFSGPELRKRVEEALASRGKPAKEPEQEEEEEEEGDPGSGPDFGRSPSRDPRGDGAGSGPAVAAAC